MLELGWICIGTLSKTGTAVAKFANFSIKGFQSTGKVLGNIGYLASAAQAYLAIRALQDGEIGGGRFVYRVGTIGTSTAWGAGVGGPVGAIGGLAIGLSSPIVEASYDTITSQLGSGYNNFMNSMNSAWMSSSTIH